MKKKDIKKKEPVKLRQKALANGNYSLYLDINWKGDREYDFLRLYLVDAKTALERDQNKSTLLLAEQIKAQRLLDLQAGKYKIYSSKENESFVEFFKECVKARINSDGNYGNWKSAQNHLENFTRKK